ncbi:hypothetical protein ACHAWF_013843 [Thalassiosira exigua]
MGDKLNTAEYDAKGRCVRHPAIRLRKKKLLGGWKIVIGHCPECCLDEMRRVRDEIGAEQDDDHSDRGGRERRHRKKKKHRERGDRHRDRDRDRDKDRDRDRDRDRQRRSKHRSSAGDSVSEAGSEGHHRSFEEGPEGGGGMRRGNGSHHPQQGQGGESEATGSTAQNSSMDGTGSVVSEQHYRGSHHGSLHGSHHGHHQGGGRPFPGHYGHPQVGHHSHSMPLPPQQQAPPPPSQQAPQRTMVLSMAFTDPQTGQRGTYTGQVNSINRKPDGKGTVYYANGGIAEGTWSNGALVGDEDDGGGGGSGEGGGYSSSSERPRHKRSNSRGTPVRGAESGAPPPPRARSSSSRGGKRMESHPPPPSLAEGGASFSGNLDRLGELGGKPRHHPRGASASVQSYNSRGSDLGGSGGRAPLGSASVQEYGGSFQASGAMSVTGGGGGLVGGGGGGVYDYRRGENRGESHGRPRGGDGLQSYHGRSPPGYR